MTGHPSIAQSLLHARSHTRSQSRPQSRPRAGGGPSLVADTEDRYLRATPLLDLRHPAIQALVRDRGWRDLPERDRVGAVYDYVRDDIAFGYNATDELPASAVLAAGYGQCNTKAILLMALLRASGVPCRLHGAAVGTPLQRGVLTGLAYRLAPSEVVHTWAEVPVAGEWVGLEGVILDRRYLDGLRRRFPHERSAFLGYGVGTSDLADPPVQWRGSGTAIQATGVCREYGVYDDPDAFHAAISGTVSGLRAVLYRRVVRHRMNRTVARIRSGAARTAG